MVRAQAASFKEARAFKETRSRQDSPAAGASPRSAKVSKTEVEPAEPAPKVARNARQLSSTYIQLDKLTAADAVAGDHFGYSVAIDGGTVVVGAPYENSEKGAVYVFRTSDGVQLANEENTHKLPPLFTSRSFLLPHSKPKKNVALVGRLEMLLTSSETSGDSLPTSFVVSARLGPSSMCSWFRLPP